MCAAAAPMLAPGPTASTVGTSRGGSRQPSPVRIAPTARDGGRASYHYRQGGGGGDAGDTAAVHIEQAGGACHVFMAGSHCCMGAGATGAAS
eukprot:5063545-Prymnesium_polylepis.1